MVIRGLGDHRGQLVLPGPGQHPRVGVTFQDGQVSGAEVPAQRAERQQLAGPVLDPLLVLGAVPGAPVGGADPPVQRGPLSAGQHQRGQPGRVEQRQPGQGVSVDPVGLSVPGQEPAQAGGPRRGNPEHRVAAGGKEHRDRQPRRAGRLDHHLQPGAVRAAGQCRRLHRGQAPQGRPGPAPGHDRALPVQYPHRVRRGNAQVDADQPPVVHPASLESHAGSHRLARRGGAPSGHGPRRPRPAAAPTHVPQPGQASTDRPASLIRGIRGQARGGNQSCGARPCGPAPDQFSTPPPGPAGMTMQPPGTSAPWWIHENRCPLHDRTGRQPRIQPAIPARPARGRAERPDPDGQRRDRHRAGARAEPPGCTWPAGGHPRPVPARPPAVPAALPRAIAAGPGNRTPGRNTHGGLGRGGYEDVMIR